MRRLIAFAIAAAILIAVLIFGLSWLAGFMREACAVVHWWDGGSCW